VSHTDPDLVEAVRQGRKKEFEAFHLEGDMPDPQSEDTLLQSSLQWEKDNSLSQSAMLEWYKRLVRWRKEHPAWKNFARESQQVHVWEDKSCLALVRKDNTENNQALIILNYSQQVQDISFPWPTANFELELDSSAAEWQGPGVQASSIKDDQFKVNPLSAAVFNKK
jgi:maltooligosyltrehalose trehalohydrolase